MTDSIATLQQRIAELTAENAKLLTTQNAVADANAHSAELMVALEEAKDELAAQNLQLQTLLDNVKSGFLVIDQKQIIGPVVTRSCQDLFGHMHLQAILRRILSKNNRASL